MSPEETTFVENVLAKIAPGMTKEEVTQILGTDYSTQPFMRMWYPKLGAGRSQVRVYFLKGKVFRVVWIKLGGRSFIYEPFPPTDPSDRAE